MKRTWYKIIFGLLKKISIGLLTGPVNASNHTKFVIFFWNPATCSCQMENI